MCLLDVKQKCTILESALPKRFTVKITPLVVSLANFHNLGIDEADLDFSPSLDFDEENLLVCGSGSVYLQTSIEHGSQLISAKLVGGVYHTDDVD